jgi:hypothetical protein
MRPPISSTSRRLMVRPSPVPPKRRGDGLVGLREFLEQLRLLRGRHADAGVGDRQHQAHALLAVAGQGFGVQRQPHLAGAGELDRVAQQVGQHLAQAQRVTQQPALVRQQRGVGDVAQQLQFLGLRGLAHQQQRARGHVFQLQRQLFQLHAAGLDLGEVEHVVDDAQQVLRSVERLAQVVALLGVPAACPGPAASCP